MAASFAACFTASQAGVLVINEVMSSNKTTLLDPESGSPDWIELYNGSDVAIKLFGYCLTDDLQNPEKFIMPDVTIAAGGYLVVYATNEKKTDTLQYDGGNIYLGFSLKASGENVALLSPDQDVLSELVIPKLQQDTSYARKSDGTYGYCAAATPNAANDTTIYATAEELERANTDTAVSPQAGILFSEVSARNEMAVLCGGCAGCDWVELQNTTDADISLDGFALTDDETDFDKANLGQDAVVPANGYLLVYCCQDDCTGAGHVCVKFGVSSAGETVYLFDTHGKLSAKIEVPATPEKDAVYARLGDGSYAFTMEATPGSANPVSPSTDLTPQAPTGNTTVRINEVLAKNTYSLADADGDRSDWVELYNPTDQAVSLLGYFLSDDVEKLDAWAFPDVTIAAHGYLLVFLSGKDRTDAELHASFSLSTDETLVLYCATDNTADQITIPDLRDNVSVGRADDGTIEYYGHPTPLEPNGHGAKEADAIGFFQTDGVFISEVCAIHERGSGENDWIELHNGGSERIVLDGWYLSDNKDNLLLWQIPDLTVAGGDYVVIEASASGTGKVASFGIASAGETLFLSDAKGNLVDVFATGVQKSGMSAGRVETDAFTERVFFLTKTRGAANSSNLCNTYAGQPTFSETALYHDAAFDLTISSLQAGATITYTTDGSAPTASSTVYTGPIHITESTVIRAMACSDTTLDSAVTTYHYLFTEPHDVPVVCIAMAPDDFSAVYRVKEHKDIKERTAYFNYYESDGLIGVTFPADIKAKGQGTLSMAQKSFSIHLRGSYGQKTVDYPFFDGYDFTKFSALVLRNGGQDYNNYRFIDSYISRACIGLHAETSNSRPVAVYINGKYYGLYDFNEDLNADYLATHYGANSDAVDLVRRNGGIATQGNNKEWKSVFNYAKTANLSSTSAYASFCEKVDVDYFIDYVIIQTYIGNTDMFNQKYWRTQDYSIRWRPILYDLDFGFRSSKTNIAHHYFDYGGTPSHNGTLTYFYITCALRTNDAFCNQYVERYVEVVCTYFNSERMLALIDTMEAEYETEMARQISRWGSFSSVSAWKSNLDNLRVIVKKRPAIALEQLRKEFGLTQSELDTLIAKYTTN